MFEDSMAVKVQGRVFQYEDSGECQCAICHTNKAQIGRWTCELHVTGREEGYMPLILPGHGPFFDSRDAAIEFLKKEGARAHATVEKVLKEIGAEYTSVNLNTGEIIGESVDSITDLIKKNMPRSSDVVH